MEMQVRENAVLPDGRAVQVSVAEEPWWMEDDRHGYVPMTLLAPDPDQPRKHMDPLELGELTESVRTVGVRQELTITPRALAPWVKLPDHTPPEMFFVIVSGHRRCEAAIRAGLPAVPVHVRVYPGLAEHELDSMVLNDQRQDLTPLEDAYRIARVLAHPGMSMHRVAQALGCSDQMVKNRYVLTKLAPDIQELLDPKLQRKKRLQLSIAVEMGFLGVPSAEVLTTLFEEADRPFKEADAMSDDERRFALQRLLLGEIQRRNLNAARATHFLKEVVDGGRRLSGEASHGSRRRQTTTYQPSKRREVFENFLSTVLDSVVLEWTGDDWGRILYNLSADEILKLLDRALLVRVTMDRLADILQKAFEAKKGHGTVSARIGEDKPTSVSIALQATRVPPAAQPVPERAQGQNLGGNRWTPATAKPAARPTDPPSTDEGQKRVPWKPMPKVGKNPKPPPRPTPNFPELTVKYFNSATGQMALGKVEGPVKYIEMFRARLFDWQREGRRKPDNFPSLEEAEQLLKEAALR